MREIVLDTETTGLDPKNGDRIVEIGALEMRNKVLTGNKFHFYLNPDRDMPTEAYRIHGISGEFLKDKPRFSDIANEFLTFVDDGILVIHNAQFDVKFLNHELSLVKKPLLDLSKSICTLAMARRLFPGMKTNLDALCKRFKVDNTNRRLHGALKDAALLAEVYIELTGGRQVTFDIKIGKSLLDNSDNKRRELSSKKARVIAPTKEELRNHKEFLTKLGIPSWSN